MKGVIVLTAASAALVTASTPQVTVKGNAFFAGNQRFYIRGVDYQPGGSSKLYDPIADPKTCKRDIVEFKKLGINTIRVYMVDNSANHDECMKALSDAGIYLALDVNTPKYSLNRANPGPSYNAKYLQSLFATVDAFANYDNTLLFFSGNEVINDDKTTNAAPYVKAVTRDLRQYIGSRGYRKIPVGYSAADVESNRYEMAQYMNCGTDDARSDFFAFNDYSWCDPSSYQQSGWDQKVKKFQDYSLPLFLSEYGCITNTRQFQEVAALYGKDMTPVYSGGLVYEYSLEDNGYGLVKINGQSVSEQKDFTALQSALKNTPPPQGDGGYQSNGKASNCPPNSKTWQVTSFSGNSLPAMPKDAEQYLKKGAGKGPGFTGEGSQNAGGGSSSTASAGSGKVTETATNSGAHGGSSSTGGSDSAGSGSSTGSHSSSTASGAAGTLRPGDISIGPFVCTAVVLAGTLVGALL
ncbi:glycoside hydrolase family 72 protein [Piedraia hortae CBS 480.64]|uniref:1,3-beta-glucanosyltransferase n=1 Tax=Piedraia hortae CBS 480.64 TaxID=1314780 RepID=A0A6A7BST2_9PEZI|nr:glycoside hydrolase family 72 protein [Piedraia hortae CBS 480.64]